MTAEGDGRSWNISVRTPLHFASLLVTPPAPVTNAFLTIETIVNYNCQLFPAPPSTQVLFNSLELLDIAGSSVPMAWQPQAGAFAAFASHITQHAPFTWFLSSLTHCFQIKHHECQQDVAIYDDGARVALMYNSSIH